MLTVDDLVLVGQPLWSTVAPVHAVTAAFAILMTSVVAMALVTRRSDARTSFVPVESGVLVALYAAASTMVFTLG